MICEIMSRIVLARLKIFHQPKTVRNHMLHLTDLRIQVNPLTDNVSCHDAKLYEVNLYEIHKKTRPRTVHRCVVYNLNLNPKYQS